MAENTKLAGQNYTTPDLVAKVTGKAKYAEDFRADGMLFAKLLLSPARQELRPPGCSRLSGNFALPAVAVIGMFTPAGRL